MSVLKSDKNEFKSYCIFKPDYSDSGFSVLLVSHPVITVNTTVSSMEDTWRWERHLALPELSVRLAGEQPCLLRFNREGREKAGEVKRGVLRAPGKVGRAEAGDRS